MELGVFETCWGEIKTDLKALVGGYTLIPFYRRDQKALQQSVFLFVPCTAAIDSDSFNLYVQVASQFIVSLQPNDLHDMCFATCFLDPEYTPPRSPPLSSLP